MDLYGLNEARSQGNAQTQDVSLFNEQVRVARDNINNAMDREKIQAQGNLRDQEGRDLQDKLIYDFHDAISGGQIASSLSKYYQTFKTAKDVASDTANKVGQAYGSAATTGDKVAEATTNEVARVRQSSMPVSLGAGTGTGASRAGGLSEEAQSSFLDESARAGGVDARPEDDTSDIEARLRALRGDDEPPLDLGGRTLDEHLAHLESQMAPDLPASQVNNRPKTNEPASANENVPEVTDEKLSSSNELSQKILQTGEEAKQTISKVSTGLRAVGDVGGLVSTYELFKGGLAKNKDGSYDVAGDVSQIASSVGTGLDILGAIIPGAGAGIEALGALAQGIGSVASTIDTHNKDEQATTDANNEVDNIESQRKAQLDALPQMKTQTAPISTMASSGLVGTIAQHTASVTGGGTF
jgi:hypothetical protein